MHKLSSLHSYRSFFRLCVCLAAGSLFFAQPIPARASEPDPWISSLLVQGQGCLARDSLIERFRVLEAPPPPPGVIILLRQSSDSTGRRMELEIVWGAEPMGSRTLNLDGENCAAVTEATALLVVSANESLIATMPQGPNEAKKGISGPPSASTTSEEWALGDPSAERGDPLARPETDKYALSVRTGAAALLTRRISPLVHLRASSALTSRNNWRVELHLGGLATWAGRPPPEQERRFEQAELYVLTVEGCLRLLTYGFACAGIGGGLGRQQQSAATTRIAPWGALLSGLHARVPMGQGGMVFNASGTYAPIRPTAEGSRWSGFPRWGQIFSWGLEYVF